MAPAFAGGPAFEHSWVVPVPMGAADGPGIHQRYYNNMIMTL